MSLAIVTVRARRRHRAVGNRGAPRRSESTRAATARRRRHDSSGFALRERRLPWPPGGGVPQSGVTDPDIECGSLSADRFRRAGILTRSWSGRSRCRGNNHDAPLTPPVSMTVPSMSSMAVTIRKAGPACSTRRISALRRRPRPAGHNVNVSTLPGGKAAVRALEDAQNDSLRARSGIHNHHLTWVRLLWSDLMRPVG
jgi:hypothetical protein